MTEPFHVCTPDLRIGNTTVTFVALAGLACLQLSAAQSSMFMESSHPSHIQDTYVHTSAKQEHRHEGGLIWRKPAVMMMNPHNGRRIWRG